MISHILYFTLQHLCPDCGKGQRTKQLLQTHRAQCKKCPYCGEWRDTRHADRCKDYKHCDVCDRRKQVGHKCRGIKLVKGKQIVCGYCKRTLSEGHMYSHMKTVHGMTWSKGAYPECIPLVRFSSKYSIYPKD